MLLRWRQPNLKLLPSCFFCLDHGLTPCCGCLAGLPDEEISKSPNEKNCLLLSVSPSSLAPALFLCRFAMQHRVKTEEVLTVLEAFTFKSGGAVQTVLAWVPAA
jgi:hypothetical protein